MNEIADGEVHRGHRARMRSKLIRYGHRIFDTYELLEMLLYYVIPYKDTNPLSKRLLARFSSLDGVLSATEAELASVDGIGERAASLISLVSRMDGVRGRKEALPPRLDSREAVAEYLLGYFTENTGSNIVVLLLDNAMRLLRSVPIPGRCFSSGSVQPREFISSTLVADASSAMIGYTYRDIVAFPHDGDMETGIAIRSALDAVGVPLLEIFAIGVRDCYALGAGERYKPELCSPQTVGCAQDAKDSTSVLGELLSFALGDRAEECATALLSRYEGIYSLYAAETDELISDFGLSEAEALLVKLPGYLEGRRCLEGLKLGGRYDDDDILSFLTAAFIGETCETVYAIAFNSEGRTCYFGTVGSGTVNRTSMFTRKVAELAVKNGADGIIIAHNHPRGVAEPSEDDEMATTGLFSLLRSLGVKLIAHMIVAGRDTCILKPDGETGMIKKITLVSAEAELSAGAILG